MDAILYAGKIGRYLAREYLKGLRSRNIGIFNSRRIFGKPEERV